MNYITIQNKSFSSFYSSLYCEVGITCTREFTATLLHISRAKFTANARINAPCVTCFLSKSNVISRLHVSSLVG